MSVYKPKGSSVYYYDFQWRGTRFYGTTGTKDRRRAEGVERSRREELKRQDARGAYTSATTTLDVAAGRWWDEVGQHLKDPGVENKVAGLINLVGKDTLLSEIDDNKVALAVVRRRAEFRRGKPEMGLVTPATVNRTTVDLLSRIMTRAQKIWKIQLPDMPDWSAHRLKEPPERIRELSFVEEDAIKAAEREDYRPARLFAQATGLRRREVVNLTWKQVDWHAGVIRVTQKGDRHHVLPITAEIRAILWSLRGHHKDSVFTYVAKRTKKCKRTGREWVRGRRYPITYHGWGTTFGRIVNKAKVEDFHIHDMRHTGATRTLRASKNLKAVQNMLGHADIKTTMRYAHALIDDVAEAMESRPRDEAARRAKSQKNPKVAARSGGKQLKTKSK
ncbi:tyrosine-type recombinase/integrase [Pseudochelatococcus sp. B33]